MYAAKKMSSYSEVKYLTADPLKLVTMCYEQAIINLKQAVNHYETGEYEAKGKAIKAALDIISELNMALDFEKGGAIAGNLGALYNFMTKQIIESDVRRDIKGVEALIPLLEDLYLAWKQILKDQTESREANINYREAEQAGMAVRGWSV